jgi:hypothetical protein
MSSPGFAAALKRGSAKRVARAYKSDGFRNVGRSFSLRALLRDQLLEKRGQLRDC